jgi:anoctamin-1
VVTNGVIIAFTSDFIPRLFHYSQYGSLDTYLNNTLSYFDAAEIDTVHKDEFFSNNSLPHYCL